MATQNITPEEFEKYLREIIDLDLSKFYYITDTLLVFKSGEKTKEKEVLTKGKKKFLCRWEYEFRIWGNWQYEKDGEVIETTKIKLGEDGINFRKRINNFIDTIHPKKITDLKVSNDGKKAEIYLDNMGKFIVFSEGDRFLSYSHNSFDEKGNIIKSYHVRPKEKMGGLVYIESTLI